MSIATAIQNAQQRVANAYTAISNKGGTIPATQNLANMPTAIDSIPSGSTPTLITKTITQNGTYNASSDNADGYSSVTVNVSGGGGYTELPPYQVSNGVASRRSGALTGTEFSNITSIGPNGMYQAFHNCSGLTGPLNLSSLTSIGSSSMYGSFYGCSGLTSVDLSALTSISNNGMYTTFQACSGLTSVNLSSLTSIANNGMYQAFRACSGLTRVDLTALTSIGSSSMYSTFQACRGLTDIYFNSLKTTSFLYVDAFSNMLIGTGTTVTHTLHFPSNLESTIQGLTGYPNFGGTSGYVVLSFDLPATS